jgi:uncharacterized protein YbaR (Trm112 family)
MTSSHSDSSSNSISSRSITSSTRTYNQQAHRYTHTHTDADTHTDTAASNSSSSTTQSSDADADTISISTGIPSTFDMSILAHLACPLCKQRLTYDETTNELISNCTDDVIVAYPIHHNIPVLLINEARRIQ